MGRSYKEPRTRLKLDPHYQEHVRAKISASGIEARLAEHVRHKNGGTMSPSQVTAALGLLKKIVPDLSATELTASAQSFVALLPEQCSSAEEWMAKAQKPVEGPRTAEASDPIDTATKH